MSDPNENPNPMASAEGTFELEAAVSKWQAIINAVVDAVILIDDRGIIAEANPATYRMFGYAEEDVIGRNISMLMPEPYRHEHDGYLRHFRETGEKRIIGIGREVLAQRKDGSIFPVQLSVGQADYDDTHMFVGVLYDLTENKRNEEHLRQAQKSEVIAQVTAGLAHDFNNLLTVIRGNLEMLEGYISHPEGHAILSEVMDAIDDGSQLIRQLLAYGRRQALQPAAVDLNTLVRHFIGLARRSVSPAIDIREDLTASLPKVLVDPGQLETALLNIILNAADALDGSGRITVATRLDKASSGNKGHAGGYVRLEVRDNGQGMSNDVLARIFEPFFTTKTAGKGSGLGLSMVQGFIKQSGGEVEVHTAIGEGTTVGLLLPVAPLGHAENDRAILDGQNALERRGHAVLLVEDNADIRRVNSRRLQSLGYDVVEAASSEAALAILAGSQPVSLLLADVVLSGGMFGHDLAVEAARIRPGLRILLTTGYEPARLGISLDGFEVIEKPFSKGDLARRLETMLCG
ncbi:PAS domain S-box protein [Pseudokordiimonas caeni]|uniref:PAS domain S-box protein n=1 Tax=Pseudokordiimonas caeni TaxID=2997908 RepID=UPI00281216A8|nr:PAS domain S-box protein [Pseudokordiimonas caeni]